MIWNNALAFLIFLPLLITFYYNYKKPEKEKATGPLVIVGLVLLIITLFKNCSDGHASETLAKQNDTLRYKVDSIKNGLKATVDTCSLNSKKLDVLNVYVHRLDSMGVKRDSITNRPKNVAFINKNGIVNFY